MSALMPPIAALRPRPATYRLLVVLGIALAAKAVAIWWSWSADVHAHVREAARTANAERRAAFVLPVRADTLARLRREMIAASDSFIMAPTPAQAATVATGVIAEAATANDLRLGTVDARADSIAHDGVRVTSLEAETSGSFAGTLAFLHTLEQGTPAFVIRHVSITPVTWVGSEAGTVRLRFGATTLARRLLPFER